MFGGFGFENKARIIDMMSCANVMKLEIIEQGNYEGFRLEIDAGIIGTFVIEAGVEETEEDLGGHVPVRSYSSECEPVLCNGIYFLPWHVSAALASNGVWDRCWLKDKKPEAIILELLKMRQLYLSDNWYSCVHYVRTLTGIYVY